ATPSSAATNMPKPSPTRIRRADGSTTPALRSPDRRTGTSAHGSAPARAPPHWWPSPPVRSRCRAPGRMTPIAAISRTTSTAANPSHTYANAGTYSVSETVYDSVNNRSSTKTVSITVTASASSQLIVNGSFETGSAAPWALTAGVLCSNSGCPGETAHSGSWFAWLDGYGFTHSDTATQTVSIPAGKTTATLAFYLHLDTQEVGRIA